MAMNSLKQQRDSILAHWKLIVLNAECPILTSWPLQVGLGEDPCLKTGGLLPVSVDNSEQAGTVVVVS